MQHVIAGIIWIHDHFTVVISHDAPLARAALEISVLDLFVAAPSGTRRP